jgi:hypothetical protein
MGWLKPLKPGDRDFDSNKISSSKRQRQFFLKMGILIIIIIFAGLGLFFTGIRLIGHNLKQMTGRRLRALVLGQLQGMASAGQPAVFNMLKIKGPTVHLDGNHPLAGQTLTFSCKVTAVRAASAEEIAHRHVHGAHGHQH